MVMEAGRELDALVAEKVMRVRPTGDLLAHLEWPPHYSTDITTAWKVLEKMQDNGWFWNIDYDYDELVAGFGKGRDSEGDLSWHYEQAETTPHAICLAALKAVEE